MQKIAAQVNAVFQCCVKTAKGWVQKYEISEDDLFQNILM